MIVDILGIDPSMRNFGLSVGKFDLVNKKIVSIDKLHLIETKPSSHRKTVRQNSLDLECATQIYKELKPFVDDAKIIFCELPVGSQSSRAQTSYGMCIGILGAVQKPIIQLTPTDIKKFVGGKNTTTKEEIIQWAYDKHPDLNWFMRGGKLQNKNEHLADSIAAIYTGIITDQFKQLMNIYSAVA